MKLKWLIVTAGLLGLFAMMWRLPRPVMAQAEADNLKREVLDYSWRWQQEKPERRADVERVLVQKAEERKAKLKTLARENPARFLQQALTAEEYDQLPQVLKDKKLTERPYKKQGVVEVIEVDDFKTHKSHKEYVVKDSPDGKERYEVVNQGGHLAFVRAGTDIPVNSGETIHLVMPGWQEGKKGLEIWSAQFVINTPIMTDAGTHAYPAAILPQALVLFAPGK